MKNGKFSPCSVNCSALCCKQVIFSSTFKNQQTNKSHTMFHQVDCSSVYIIYLIQCTLCKKQYIGKSETSLNIRLNNHRKEVKKRNAISACRLFKKATTFSTKTQS